MVLSPMNTHLTNYQKCSDCLPDRPYGRFALDIQVPVKIRSFDYMVDYLINTIIMGGISCWARWIHTYITVTNGPMTRRTGPAAALLQVYLCQWHSGVFTTW
jgi:hypothetical protein